MSFHELSPSPGPQTRAPGLTVQRKCACGTHSQAGECDECRERKQPIIQRRDRGEEDLALHRFRSESLGPGAGGGFTHDFSRLAVNAEGASPALRTTPRIQRQPLPDAPRESPALPSSTPSATPAPDPAPSLAPTNEPSPETAPEPTPEASPEAPASAQPAILIAEDGADDLEPGQLRKSEFLDQLETAVCAEADASLAGTEQSTDGCPYLASWFAHYRGQSSRHVESAVRRYAPETRRARTASEYVPIVASRVRQGVERWSRTGEITGVPEGVPLGMASGLGGVAAGTGGLLFKERDGGARAVDDPAAVLAELGSGGALESGVRSRMESAFGRSFAHVRLHNDATASRLSSEQNARAITVGEHVAFAASEYRPGTLVGDALIAHELAHVVQQDGASKAMQSKAVGAVRHGALEKNADEAAVRAVASLWSGGRDALAVGAARGMTQLRSGLRLQRCGGRTPSPRRPEAHPGTAPDTDTPTGLPAPGRPTQGQPSQREPSQAGGEGTGGGGEGTTEATGFCATASDHPGILALLSKAGAPTPNRRLAYGFTFWSKNSVTRPKLDVEWAKAGSLWTGTVKRTAASMGKIEALFLEKGTHEVPNTKVQANFPQCGSGGKKVPFFSEVSESMSLLSRQAEQEHCDDYARAFSLTYETWANNINSMAGTPFGPGSKAQVNAKISNALKALGDKGENGWVAELNRLKGLSPMGRDHTGFHALKSDGPPAKADPGCTKVIGTTLKASTTKVPGPPSKDLIK